MFLKISLRSFGKILEFLLENGGIKKLISLSAFRYKENFLEITNFARMVQLYNRRIEMHLSIFNLEIDAFREM